MFERRHERQRAEAARAAATARQRQRDGYAEMIDLAEHFAGVADPGMILAASETVFYKVSGAALIETRRGPGRCQGHSSGFSVPVASIGGHAVRYRVGASRGHYVAAPPTPTAIDTGTVHVTNHRVVFQGAKQTRECLYTKLLGYHHDPDEGTTVLSVSNRQKPTTIHYGADLAADFAFRLDLALAHHHGTVDQLTAALRHDLDQIEAQHTT